MTPQTLVCTCLARYDLMQSRGALILLANTVTNRCCLYSLSRHLRDDMANDPLRFVADVAATLSAGR